MAKKTVDALVEGGKATPAPPLAPALAPLGVNIGQVVEKINEKTAAFAGMRVPVKVIIDDATKEFEIEVGTPPTSALIKKELGIQKGSGDQKEKVADISLDQLIKVAKMKESSLLGKSLKEQVKEAAGTCVSMGITVEKRDPREIQKMISAGDFDSKFQ